jgi:putative aldouronate transport system substrate-binding protein
MIMKKSLAILLALAMLVAMTACGSTTSSTAAASTADASSSDQTTVSDEAAATDETPAAPAEAASAEEPAPADSAEEPAAASVTYPLSESYTFTMTVTMRNNVLSVLGDDDFSVTSAYRGLAEATGCSVEFNSLGEATAEEKTNIMLASGDMTDFYTNMGSYGSNLAGAITDGILFDFTPYLDEYAPDYKALLDSDQDLKDSATNPDGTICVFLSQAADIVDKGIIIRQDWLDKLGLEVPTNREDLEVVLQQFKTEMGATMPILVNDGLESGLTASFNVSYAGLKSVDYQLTEPNGTEVVACFASENFIEYLVYMNHLYQEGLVTDDFMSTSRENGNWESSYYTGKSGVWSDGYRELDPSNRSNADDPDYVATAMALTDYECHVSERSTVSMNGQVFLTTACKEPELAMEFMNYCYTTEGRHNGLYGMLGEGYTLADDGSVELTENVTNNANGWSISSALIWYGGGQWMPTCVDMEYYELIGPDESVEGIKYWTEAYGDTSMKLPGGVSLSEAANTEFNEYANDILTLFSEGAVKVVTGDLDEAGYRELIETANGMGLTRMTELYQEAYDEYLAG